MDDEFITLKLDDTQIDKSASQIVFSTDAGKWFMKITASGLVFNREEYPNCEADVFSKAFMELLEKQFKIKFIGKGAE